MQSRPSRLRERHKLNQQLTDKPAKPSPRAAEAYRRSKQEERPRPDYKSPTAQVAHNSLLSSGRKRLQTEIEEEQPAVATPSPLPPWKRVKQPFQSHQEANTAFWDSLSKVWLTKCALEEFNRRTARLASPARPAPLSPRDLRRKTRSDQIKHFARHGGPDLCGLRGVRLIDSISRVFANHVPAVSRAYRIQFFSSHDELESVHYQNPRQVHEQQIYPKDYHY